MSALLASRFEQLRLQPASVDHDVSPRWTPAVHNFSKKASNTADLSTADLSTADLSTADLSTADQIFRDAGLRMRIATEADKPAILQFLRNFFFQDEPLNVAVKLLTSGHGKRCEELEEFCVSDLGDNVSIICESTDNCVEGIAALSLCGVIERSKEEKLAKSLAAQVPLGPLPEEATPEERFARIGRLLDTAIAGADVFGRMPKLERLIDIKILSVHPAYRGKKVAIGMCDKIRDIAAEKGIDILRIVCSSHFSALAASRLGYECIHSLSYRDFVDSKGNRIFSTEPPHNAVTTYILNLRNKS